MHRLVATQAQNAFLRPGADATYADGDDASWQSVDWPAMTRRLQVLGTEINLIDTGGSGPVIVWVHGLGGCWQNWLLNLPAFMRDHRCLALDLPGFGESPLPADPLSIEYYGRIVDGLCDTLGIERATVVGSSMGGFIGAEVAIKFGTRVDRLVLVSAAGLSIEYQRREPLLTLARVASLGTSRVAAYHRLVVRRPRLRRAAMQTVIRYPERLSPALAFEQLRGTGKPGFVGALDALLSYSFRDRLSELEMPVLVVWGANDMLVPPSDADRFVELIGPNARKVIFEDCGHGPMIERPTRFNNVLSEFLAGDPTPESEVAGVHA